MREVLFARRAILTRPRPGDEEALALVSEEAARLLREAGPEAVAYVLRDGAGHPVGALLYRAGRVQGAARDEALLADGRRALIRALEAEGKEVEGEG